MTSQLWAAWISAIAAVMSSVSILILWRQLRADHERSRREKTIEMMTQWNTSFYECVPPMAPIIFFVQGFTEEQCASLWDKKPLSFKEDLRHALTICMGALAENYEIEESTDGLSVNPLAITTIRTQIANYLNGLEILATAWRHHVVDREMIEEEFKDIFSNEAAITLDRLVKTAGKGIYPSIKEIRKRMIEIEERIITRKPVA